MTGLLLLILSAGVHTVSVPPAAREVHVPCPAGETTRIVLPEPLRQLRGRPEAKAALGFRLEQSRPQAVLSFRPPSHPSSGRFEFQGPTLTITLIVETTIGGGPLEEPVADRRATPPPAVAPSPPDVADPVSATTREPEGATSPLPTPLPLPSSPAPSPLSPPSAVSSPAAPAGPADLVWAKLVPIGRREGLPGQATMVLVDALSGAEWIWFRFRLDGGAQSPVAEVTWEQGAVSTFDQQADGKDRRVVVRLPRAKVTPRTRLTLTVESGPTYRFALNAPTLGNAVRTLFP